ncbi:MAG: geranylgeranylglyceryl/heptaprenylglyceryl phosphate synthase [Candidatus Marsarchaeota archaeon]|nr:geranylgeranylglyceryl/heptaprenylglyceryl phosphate synthase [Candidatus Marsarchaeota archaeon]
MSKVYDALFKKGKPPLIIGLIDPAKLPVNKLGRMLSDSYNSFNCLFVGGSTSVYQTQVEDTIRFIRKRTNRPLIIFPGGLTNLTPLADAVLFISLINSSSTFYVIEQQFQAAPLIKQMGLEPISTAYIIVGGGGTAGYVGHARPIPFDKPEIVAGYALAAEYLGFKLVYLEAGSGSESTVPPEVVAAVKKVVKIPVLVGGGIRTIEKIREIMEAGANGVVLGNVLEDPAGSRPLLEKIEKLLRDQT